MARAVLWDLDGTLVDSAEFHWLSWRDTMAAEGVSLTYQQFLDTFGQKNDRILPGWLGPGADADRIRRVGDAKEAEYRRLASVHGLTPLPGASSWVRRLHAQGWQQAIASSAPGENVGVMLRALALDGMFEAIVSAEDVTRGKPDPQVFLAAAERLGVPARSLHRGRRCRGRCAGGAKRRHAVHRREPGSGARRRRRGIVAAGVARRCLRPSGRG